MYRLPDSLRDKLRTPIGDLIRDEKQLINSVQSKEFIVAVGDLVSLTLIDHDVAPDVCVVDFKTRRGPLDESSRKKLSSVGEQVMRITNPSGYITDELLEAIKKAVGMMDEQSVRIEIAGEEDLASLPAILFAPIGTTVIYGLPDKGVLLVDVSEKNKNKVRAVLEEMKVS